MLKQLQKFFNTANSAATEEVKMIEENTGAKLATVDTTVELANATEALAASTAAMQTMLTELSETKAALAALVAEKELVAAAAGATKMAVRLSKLSAAIGDEKAPALLSVTESMDDAGFEAVVAAMSVSVVKESKTVLFTDIGLDVRAETISDGESSIMKALKAQYKDQ